MIAAFVIQAITNFAEQRARLARRADRRDEWRAQMEREKLDILRERFELDYDGALKTLRAIRDVTDTYFWLVNRVGIPTIQETVPQTH